MDVPTWKWEFINMDLVVWLAHTQWKNDSIWVIGDRLTKSFHFISVKSTYMVEDYAIIYINDIVSLHWIPLSVITDIGAQFTTHFLRLFKRV